MWRNIDYEHAQAFVQHQVHPGRPPAPSGVKPAVTISRQTGAGGRTVASKLAEYLQARVPVECGWTVFDKNLMDKVLADHHLAQAVSRYEPEGHKAFFRDWMEEFLELHPPTWSVVQQTAETIWKLATMGHAIIVGRGAAVVTAGLPQVFHVRLVSPVERRLAQVQEVYHLEADAAREFLKTEDKGRARYLKDHYHRDIEDPLLYDLVINTDRCGHDAAAELIGEAIIHRHQLVRPPVSLL